MLYSPCLKSSNKFSTIPTFIVFPRQKNTTLFYTQTMPTAITVRSCFTYFHALSAFKNGSIKKQDRKIYWLASQGLSDWLRRLLVRPKSRYVHQECPVYILFILHYHMVLCMDVHLLLELIKVKHVSSTRQSVEEVERLQIKTGISSVPFHLLDGASIESADRVCYSCFCYYSSRSFWYHNYRRHGYVTQRSNGGGARTAGKPIHEASYFFYFIFCWLQRLTMNPQTAYVRAHEQDPWSRCNAEAAGNIHGLNWQCCLLLFYIDDGAACSALLH